MKHEVYFREASEPTIFEDNEEYMVDVRGWIMCDKVESGKYRIKISTYFNYGIATFYRPREKKAIARHYLENLMFMLPTCKDLNGTILLEKITK